MNAQGGYYGNALHTASRSGREDIVKLLLDNGADVNILDTFGHTALQYASFRDFTSIVNLLLDKNGNIGKGPR